MRLTAEEPGKSKSLDVIQQFLSREFPDFIVQGRHQSGKRFQITLHRVEDGTSYRIKIAPHFVEYHQAVTEIETFLEHHGLAKKLHTAGARLVIIDNAGVHFGRAEK
jgi:hypothetical protein